MEVQTATTCNAGTKPTKNAYDVLHPSQDQFKTPRLTTVKVKEKQEEGNVSTHACNKLKLNTTRRRTRKSYGKVELNAIFALPKKQE
jgi:hypothetical protein